MWNEREATGRKRVWNHPCLSGLTLHLVCDMGTMRMYVYVCCGHSIKLTNLPTKIGVVVFESMPSEPCRINETGG